MECTSILLCLLRSWEGQPQRGGKLQKRRRRRMARFISIIRVWQCTVQYVEKMITTKGVTANTWKGKCRSHKLKRKRKMSLHALKFSRLVHIILPEFHCTLLDCMTSLSCVGYTASPHQP